MPERPQISYLYVPTTRTGYGRAGSAIANSMRNMGIDVYDHLEGTERGDKLNSGARTGRSNVMAWFSTPAHAQWWYKGQHTVMYTMWETRRLPEDFRQIVHEFDQLIVPSMQNLELFGQYHDDVSYVPLGIDPNVWCYRKRKPPTNRFNFLISGAGSRKGSDLAVNAFLKLYGRDGSWGDGPVPYLMMKNPRGDQHYGKRIEMYTGKISDEDEIGLFAQAHCYLQPSRGEGFGLMPLQAIAQGCPTILTNAHGQASYAHLGYPISAVESKADYFIFGDAGEWWEPNLDELIDRMRHVYENYDTAAMVAEVNSQAALRNFTWDNTANGMLDAIGRDKLGPYNGPDERYVPERKLYKIITERDHVFNVGGTNFAMKKGEEYWQTSDVKRVLFEANVLDVACLGPEDQGLSPIQVERLGLYRAEHSQCPTCHQPLNRDAG